MIRERIGEAGRDACFTWFFLLGVAAVATICGNLHRMAWTDLTSRGLTAVYWLTIAVYVRRRPLPALQPSLAPSIAAYLGTYLPLLLPVLGRNTALPTLQITSSVLLLTGGALAVFVVLHLGRCFSLVPQAHNVVKTGPYRLIRHPLYVAEEIAIVGVALHYLSPAGLALTFVHAGIQLVRIRYEEELLRRELRDYRDYAATTAAVIPGVW